MNDISSEILTNLLCASGDEILLCDLEGNIKFKNNSAQEAYPKAKNISKIIHLFNFEICILKSEDILTYNPINAALTSKEPFFANITKQIKLLLFLNFFNIRIILSFWLLCLLNLAHTKNITALEKFYISKRKKL